MTDHKSSAQFALAQHLLEGGITRVCDELARLMLSCHDSDGFHLPSLDEQATVHSIAGGQGEGYSGVLARDAYWAARDSEPLTTMPRNYEAREPEADMRELVDSIFNANARIRLLESERDEAQAELTRIKADNERLEQTRVNLRKLLDATRVECRKRDAVVEAARRINRYYSSDYGFLELNELRVALSALDRTEGERAEAPKCICPKDEPGRQRIAPGCPRHDKRAEAPKAWGSRNTVACIDCGAAYQNTHRTTCPIGRDPLRSVASREDDCMPDCAPEPPPVADSSDAVREIKFESTWKQAIPPGIHVKVVSVVGGVQYQWRGEKGYDDVSEAEFRMHFVWVSDPEPAEEPKT